MAPTDISTTDDPRIVAGAELLRLMSNPNRLTILHRLARGEASVSEMEQQLCIRQPTLSQQLAELRKGGVISDRRQAKSVFYRLTDGRTRTLIAILRELFAAHAAAPVTGKSGARPVREGAGGAPDAPAALHGRIPGRRGSIRSSV